MYYSIVEKATGIMHEGWSNYIHVDDADRPLHESLAYVPLNELLTKLLTTDGTDIGDELHPIDYKQTHYDFNTSQWVIIYQDDVPEAVDPVATAQELKDQHIAEVNAKLSIPDLSTSARTKLEAHLTELTSIAITAETVKTVVFPVSPF
jgi:uncharacterized protein YheU (UPF0270 family)